MYLRILFDSEDFEENVDEEEEEGKQYFLQLLSKLTIHNNRSDFLCF